ncbi:hypothetical protein VPLG_00128 [Vibrio phage eugene 12A10]|uniref:hypothetical protein n=1 Tax=Vibrio phage eugene 12A10 TaxID=573172 RepID=UPI000351D879|nr:hypothetical protein VPLG_00128 [Vibrio phage eugene 12A10]AGN51567.1 hypothetical protein VPLG_00128 [Vibrio phage eugene 12A10]
MLTQSDLDYGFTEEDFQYSVDTFEESMLVISLYNEFKEVVTGQLSWAKWHIMDRMNVSYSTAEKVLKLAVDKGVVHPEDYYHHFVVINK